MLMVIVCDRASPIRIVLLLQFTGEATPYYMMSPAANARLKAMVPHVKLIICVRDPVERLFSQYVRCFPSRSLASCFGSHPSRNLSFNIPPAFKL